jgi:hypothetical protein
MNNQSFLKVLKETFITYLSTHPRSNQKLKILHGAIAQDLDNKIKKMNKANYSISALGFNNGKEEKIQGRYINKTVDITIKHNQQTIAGIGVKYVMSNYFQNSNNYFENMLGETANIRCNQQQYFQILVIPDKLPYFNDNKKITRWEEINNHHLTKYIRLSQDNSKQFFHTPDKTLLFIIHISESDNKIETQKDYTNYYLKNDFSVQLSDKVFHFNDTVIFNNYETFTEKLIFSILAK